MWIISDPRDSLRSIERQDIVGIIGSTMPLFYMNRFSISDYELSVCIFFILFFGIISIGFSTMVKMKRRWFTLLCWFCNSTKEGTSYGICITNAFLYYADVFILHFVQYIDVESLSVCSFFHWLYTGVSKIWITKIIDCSGHPANYDVVFNCADRCKMPAPACFVTRRSHIFQQSVTQISFLYKH